MFPRPPLSALVPVVAAIVWALKGRIFSVAKLITAVALVPSLSRSSVVVKRMHGVQNAIIDCKWACDNG